ncbi:MAG: threonine/serine dehydratase [Stackebrandtia sp.]
MITKTDVDAAVARISGRVRTTPLLTVEPGVFGPGVVLKCEYTQHTGSFKTRGAFNRILAATERGELTDSGVVAASGGNAGLAVAYAAGRLGIPAAVFVPETAPRVKVDKLRALGAAVHQVGAEFAVANAAAIEHAEMPGALLCHAYDQPEIVAGQGSLAVELLDQTAGAVDTVLVSVGGGGLMGGIAAGLDGRAKVVAVEPETIPTLHTALSKGEPVDIAVSGVAADSLGARRIGEHAFALATGHGVASVLVDDESVIAARALLWDKLRIVVEHGTAAALAALLTGVYRPAEGERVAVILCGANTDPSDLVS